MTIGSRVFVAMGSVVTADVADGAEIMGVPARERADKASERLVRSEGDE